MAAASKQTARIGRTGDGALERLLARCMLLRWLSLNAAEIRGGVLILKDGATRSAVETRDRLIARLGGELLRATRALTLVRRLVRALAVQENLGQQQINLVAATNAGEEAK